MSFLDNPKERMLTLTWQEFGAQQALPGALLANSTLRAQQDIFGNIVHQLRAMVLSDTFANDKYEQSLSVPASSWQMFKEEHATSWWLHWLVRRRPVKYKKHTAVVEVERMHLYPEARVKTETFGPVRIYEHVTSTYWNKEN